MFHRPASLEDAIRFLKRSPESRAIAGGQALALEIKHAPLPCHSFVAVDQLGALKGIAITDGPLTVGAAESHRAIADSEIVRAEIPALAKLAYSIGDPQIRNRGTFGGALVSNFLYTDYQAALLALSAQIQTTQRTIGANVLAMTNLATSLVAAELVVSVSFQVPDRASYQKLAHRAGGYAELAVFWAQFASGETRIALIGKGVSPVLVSSDHAGDSETIKRQLLGAERMSPYQNARISDLLDQAKKEVISA